MQNDNHNARDAINSAFKIGAAAKQLMIKDKIVMNKETHNLERTGAYMQR